MMPMGKNQRVKDIIERQKAELVAIAQKLEAVTAERDSLRTAMAAKSAANEDLRERALRAEEALRRVNEALDQVST